MCGICGIYNLENDRPITASQIQKMTDRLTHRGPDDSGMHIDRNFGMGMRRLSIVDLKQGQQPISNERETVHVVCNGEIYNHRALRQTLAAKGHTFRSRSDTEVIVHAYEEYGESFVKRLNGMFAFALWDKTERVLIIGRDRLGIKPLYYYHDQTHFGFASELRALTEADFIDRRLEPRAIDCLFTFEYIPAPLTMFQNVRKLLPGHLLKIRPDTLRTKKYWDLRWESNGHVGTQAVEHNLLSRLTESVSRQLMADVPVGAFLSGGLDSSLVVALMSQLSSHPIKTFSIGFAEAGFNELPYARIVAKHCGTDHHELTVNPNDIELIIQAIMALDEPLADPSIVPTLLVSRLAREHVKVVLSGDGGDELFAGYDCYRADRIASMYEKIPRIARSSLLEPLVNSMPQTYQRLGLVNSVKGLIRGMGRSRWLGHARWLTYLSPDERNQLYHKDFLAELQEYDCYSHIRNHSTARDFPDTLSQQLHTDLKSYLVDDVLVKVDRMSMAVSLEVRPPLLDHELVEYVAGLPSELKLRGLKSKYILKKVASKLLPPIIVNRKKSGFAMPVKNWLRKELKPLLLDSLSDSSFNKHGKFFNRNHILKLIDEHDSLQANHSHVLWTLCVLSIWCEKNLRRS